MESKKAVYETNIDVNAAIKKAKDELVDYHNKFMSIMNDYEIDVYFSELAAEYNLTPVDLTINEASETEIKSFSVALQEAKAESNSKSETTSNKSCMAKNKKIVRYRKPLNINVGMIFNGFL